MKTNFKKNEDLKKIIENKNKSGYHIEKIEGGVYRESK